MHQSRHAKQEDSRQDHEKSGVVLASCLVGGDISSPSGGRGTRGGAFGISLAFESLVLGLLVVTPLLTSIARPQFRSSLQPKITFFRPGTQVVAGPRVTTSTSNHPPKIFDPYQPITPVRLSQAARTEGDTGISDPFFDGAGPVLPGGDFLIGGAVNEIMSEPKPIAQSPHAESHPLKMSEGVLQAQLISRIEPRYPALAKETKTEGVVRLHAIISRDGRITSLDVLSGHPLLVQAALEAVSQWRYRPTMLNGEPVEVETSITVIFRLHD